MLRYFVDEIESDVRMNDYAQNGRLICRHVLDNCRDHYLVYYIKIHNLHRRLVHWMQIVIRVIRLCKLNDVYHLDNVVHLHHDDIDDLNGKGVHFQSLCHLFHDDQ